jgi:hypothetical protein
LHIREELDRRLAIRGGELIPRDAVAPLGLVAEREQGLPAAGRRSGAGDLQHLVGREVRSLAPSRRMGERAVVADVPAQLRQRDEDLRRVGDDRTAAQAPGLGEQLFEGPVEHAMSIRAGGKVTAWTFTCSFR